MGEVEGAAEVENGTRRRYFRGRRCGKKKTL